MVGRIRWTCPACNRAFAIPAGNNPTLCPDCTTARSGSGDELHEQKEHSLWRSKKLVVIASIAVAVLLVAFISLSFVNSRLPGGIGEMVGIDEPDHDEREAVRAWLRDNTDTGRWEEVRWWPVAELEQFRNAEIDALRSQLRQSRTPFAAPVNAIQNEIDQLRAGKGPSKAIRLTYRTPRSGDMQLRDEVLMLDGEFVAKCPNDFRNSLYLTAIFPDDARLIESSRKKIASEFIPTNPGHKESSINLQHIALAVHNFHDEHARLPSAASFNKDGEPLLSWRVAILPYLGEEKLFKEFHHNEPWDSPHNRKLIPRMPKVFRFPDGSVGDGKTVYLALRGNGTVFPQGRSISFRDITDGTSFTVLAVEAARENAVVWTKPDDIAFDPNDRESVKKIAGSRRGFLVLLVDGVTIFLPDTTDADNFRRLTIRNDGEQVEL